MNIISKNVGNTTYIGLVGELDEHTAVKTKTDLDNILESANRRIVFDFSGLDFMDSTGVGVLIGRYKKYKPENYSFFLSGANPTLEKVLKLSGIYSIMPKLEI